MDPADFFCVCFFVHLVKTMTVVIFMQSEIIQVVIINVFITSITQSPRGAPKPW